MKRIINWDELPVALTPRELTKIIPIGQNNAYELCHRKGFPALKVGGRKFIIPRDALKRWLEEQTIGE